MQAIGGAIALVTRLPTIAARVGRSVKFSAVASRDQLRARVEHAVRTTYWQRLQARLALMLSEEAAMLHAGPRLLLELSLVPRDRRRDADWLKHAMKTLLAATLTFAMLIASGHAQEVPGGPGAMPDSDGTSGGKHRKGSGQKAQAPEKSTRVDDKGYRAAIERLPDQRFDPWHNTR